MELIEFHAMMRYYPINLDVCEKACLVVGGGHIGERKVLGLLQCEAQVEVVSPQATQSLQRLASQGQISLQLKRYAPSNLAGKFLVFGATNDNKVNQQVYEDATRLGVLCNIVDNPDSSAFVLPAMIRRGELVVTISTSNRCPAVAKWIRKRMEKELGPEYEKLLELMGTIRQKLLRVDANRTNGFTKVKLECLLERGILDMIREHRSSDINNLVTELYGNDFNETY